MKLFITLMFLSMNLQAFDFSCKSVQMRHTDPKFTAKFTDSNKQTEEGRWYLMTMDNSRNRWWIPFQPYTSKSKLKHQGHSQGGERGFWGEVWIEKENKRYHTAGYVSCIHASNGDYCSMDLTPNGQDFSPTKISLDCDSVLPF